jgi:hypothetical protein
MTDGKIYDTLVENFATRTTEVGLHNKASIVIVFGDASLGRPATCDISVGIAIYAVVPDCLFLFHDIPTGIVRTMQAKGRFKQLLPVTAQQRPKLVVTMYTAWAELARTSYEDLFNIELGIIRPLERDEMALENGLIINLPDMLAGKVGEATMEQIVRDRDNLRSIALASKTRGTGKDLAAWLKAQQKPLPEKNAMPEDINDRAHQAINELLEALRTNSPVEKLEDLRHQVRSAHESNLTNFWRKRAKDEDNESVILHTNLRLQTHAAALADEAPRPTSDDEDTPFRRGTYTVARCGYDSSSGRKTPELRSDPPKPMVEKSERRFRLDDSPKTRKSNRSKRLYRGRESWSESSSVISFDRENELDPVLLPGFRRQKPVNEFKGRCMLCHSPSVLTLLLKSPPAIKTNNFPPEGKNAKIAFPLAMGNFAEMDVISFFISCDACAFHLLRIGTCPSSDTIVGALCLVCLPENQGVWLEAVGQAVRGRFDIADLIAICVAIVEAKLVENEARDALSADRDLFRDCAEWTLRNLAQILDVPATLSLSFSNGKEVPMMTLGVMFLTDHFSDPGHVDNMELLLLRYPIPGFMVLLRLLCLTHLRPEQAQTLLFQKVVFQVMEQCIAMRMSAMPPLPVAEILGLSNRTEKAGISSHSNSVKPDGKTSTSILELVEYGLLDRNSLQRLEGCPEFESVKSRGGPAMAVFLHKLFRRGHAYSTAASCFNAFKVMSSMKTVMHAPLAIGGGLAADMISQL